MRGITPVVIGHRGAPGYRPEHTLASYRLAIEMGADYVEPDLVSTRDGVLVARHENEISGTTDVACRPELARRRTTKVIDGREVTGWFTEDLTLAELKTLRAKERLPGLRPGNTWYDGHFEIPTFDEILHLAEQGSRRRGVTIGVYPETKHPTYFASLGLPLEEPLVAALRRHHLDRPNAPVLVQSFEIANLRRLAAMVSVPLVQLVDAEGAPYDVRAAGQRATYADLCSPSGLREVATYAAAVGVNQALLLPAGGGATAVTHGDHPLVDAAHRAGLLVHAWTVRDENEFLHEDHRRGDDPRARGDAGAAVQALLEAGVDGVFTDHPDTAVEARRHWLAGRERRVTAVAPIA
ncbi:MAG TPA: glycerophosphodiester phosphodiesterase [Nocardioidaceae bacterium]|nr:glycerophosphodiester phosphodiesterase [Nocardioidaceae bacterium]